jgi:phosphoribosylformylglycinamidine synthase
MRATVTVMLRDGVLDPQGEAVRRALGALGHQGVRNVRQGRVLVLELEDAPREEAEARLRRMCDELLANTVIENYRVEIG